MKKIGGRTNLGEAGGGQKSALIWFWVRDPKKVETVLGARPAYGSIDRLFLVRDPHTGALIWFWVRDPKKVETVLGA